MRLTLRTLLAYMDGILDPADQEELSKKIEESDVATEMVHRSRDTMRRLRLSAPQTIGSGLGLDPNTVAEYLDNTLPVENVADMERICLESDVHLAEAACCHHVLTMILGEPAQVDPGLKERMYKIADELENRKRLRLEPSHPVQAEPPMAGVSTPSIPLGTEVIVPPPSFAEPPVDERASESSTEIPDYLRASQRSPLRIFAKTLIAASILGVAAYFVASQMGWLESKQVAEGGDVGSTPEPVVPPIAGDERTAGPPQEEPVEPTMEDSGETTPEQPNAESGLGDRYSAQGPVEPMVDDTNEDSSPAETEAAEEVAEVAEEIPSSLPPGNNPPVSSAGPGPALVQPEQAELRTGAPDTMEADITDEGDSAPSEPEPPAFAVDPVDTGPVEMGMFLAEPGPDSPEQLERKLLLRKDAESSAWFSMPSKEPLMSGEQVMTLPTFRSTVALKSGLVLELSGATKVSLGTNAQANSRGGQPLAMDSLETAFGRVILINMTEQEKSVELVAGDAAALITLSPSGNSGVFGVAMEVEREWMPGIEPKVEPAMVRATVYAPMGGVNWYDGTSTFAVAEPAKWTFVSGEDAEPEAFSQPIEWLEQEPATSLELRGAGQIRERLKGADLAADKVLLEMTGDRRKEVRSLATLCGAYVGQYAPFVRALDDSDQRSTWPEYISTLRQSMAQSPESANQVHQALITMRGPAAATDLYEMLCGYSREEIGSNPDKVSAGPLGKLVNWLESDSLDYRVLAAHNLMQITGKNLLQNPAASPSDRAQGVRRWRKRLEDGELRAQESYGI